MKTLWRGLLRIVIVLKNVILRRVLALRGTVLHFVQRHCSERDPSVLLVAQALSSWHHPSFRAFWESVGASKRKTYDTFISRSITLRNAVLIRVWYRRPSFLNQASTSASSRSVTGLFNGR